MLYEYSLSKKLILANISILVYFEYNLRSIEHFFLRFVFCLFLSEFVRSKLEQKILYITGCLHLGRLLANT